jgi:hypothetical protein
VLLDEGYLTGAHATPQAALEEAIGWIDSEEAKAKDASPT